MKGEGNEQKNIRLVLEHTYLIWYQISMNKELKLIYGIWICQNLQIVYYEKLNCMRTRFTSLTKKIEEN